MTNRNKTQLGYFIDFSLWQDALELINFQIRQKQTNRHFNTLSLFYYERIDVTCLNDAAEEYFNIKISSNLFYGLKKEFSIFSYVIPKQGLGLRERKFFTYPMRVVYYAVGLYLLKLSQEFLNETYKQIKSIKSFYGGDIKYKKGKLELNSKNIYFFEFYKEFTSLIKEEVKSCEDRVILKIDIENYFNELSISRLLHFLGRFIKPSVQAKMSYDIFTKESIICLFQFISNGKSGIPQSDNDTISSFIGYLYLVFGDLFIDDALRNYSNVIDSYRTIRYTDDIYISITFKQSIDQKNRGLFIHLIASQIAEILYRELGLKLNLKTRLFHLSQKKEKDELLKNIRKSSPSDEYSITLHEDNNEEKKEVELISEKPQDKLNKIFKELKKIKNSNIENSFIIKDKRYNSSRETREEILREVFDKRVEQIIDKPENKSEIKQIFKKFNFELVKVQPLEILIILLKDENATSEFRKMCLDKNIITTGDVDLIIKFLCQTGFNDQDLLKKLKKNDHMNNIVDIFLNNELNCDKPGYYNLTCMRMKKLSEMPDVLEQTRLRILSERNKSYSVALNHLVNEIHAVCIKQERAANKKEYDVNKVVNFLRSKGIQHEICIRIRNLFDRRNSNSVSHPGSDGEIAWEVTEEEYREYYKCVGQCLEVILT